MGTVQERFWRKVSKVSECWEWIASLDSSGYGFFSLNGHMRRAHRVSWEIHNGSVPEGLQVLHHCDNRKCIRPIHLFLGTNNDNIADRMAKGRKSGASGERNGHAKLSWPQVFEIRKRLAFKESQELLARDYKVSQQLISRIACGGIWDAVQ